MGTIDQSETNHHETLDTSRTRLQMLGYRERLAEQESFQQIPLELERGSFAGPAGGIVYHAVVPIRSLQLSDGEPIVLLCLRVPDSTGHVHQPLGIQLRRCVSHQES